MSSDSKNPKGFFVINNIQYNYQQEFAVDFPLNRSKQFISLLEYCLSATIHIPHYCYHKQLSIAGNCRMCLVELKKSPKPIVSCAMNAQSTLKTNAEIFTNSPLVKKARENIMEFLLLNHPLDCPICDQGGECDLQDQSLFFGLTKKRFYNYKRVVTDKDLGPIVKTVMTRCIHCTRCVRFATEIAGVEELGVFGRGIHSEIGTYINKTFQSELSGNIIDLCPVGALTSKPYPFAGRNWELKRIKTIDLSDGYGLDIQVFLKNNIIVKVLSGYDNLNTNNPSIWISDKTRFLFDSISSHGNVSIFTNSRSEKTNELLWYGIFTKLLFTIYLSDHLQRHGLHVNHFVVMFDENSSVEVVSILLLLEKKYSFFQLKRTLKIKMTNDFQSNFQINALRHSNMLSSSNMCLLLNTNTRYESPYLNLKLKKRYSAGNFRTFSISSQTNLTFPSVNIGSNLEKLESVVEGNNNTGHTFKQSKNLLAVLNTEILLRQDSVALVNLFTALNTFCVRTFWNIFNVLSTSLNSVGISNLHSFKGLCRADLNKSSGIFFINNGLRTSKMISKFMELALLNHSFTSINNKIVIEQNFKNILSTLQNKLNIHEYIYLPSNTFFESTGSYINTEGNLKCSTKLISAQHNTKDDWVILRKLISVLETIEFLCDIKNNTRIHYSNNNLFNFKNLISFLFINTQNLSKFSFHRRTFSQPFKIISIQKIKKLKILSTQLKKTLEDFYLGGFDNYSYESKTMILCSMDLRENSYTLSKSR
jgi:NADH-quinone oxidoreductase chain G